MVLDAAAGDSQCFSREATPFYLNHADFTTQNIKPKGTVYVVLQHRILNLKGL